MRTIFIRAQCLLRPVVFLGLFLVTVCPAPAQETNRPFLSARIQASGIDEYGNEEPFVRSKVEEFISTSMRPLLPYVFFGEDSAVLPARYHTLSPADTATFHIDRLYGLDELATYHHMLNILARRLQQHPAVILTLTGCNTDCDSERQATDLSRRRANAVRDYFTEVWSIPSERIHIDARNLPEAFSPGISPGGIAENRRVEITSSDPALLAPLVTRDTLRRATPPMIRFRPDVSSDARVISWELTAWQGNDKLKTFTGKGSLPEFIDWDLHYDPSSIPRLERNLEYNIEIMNDSQQLYVATGTPISVEQITLRKKRIERLADREIDRYPLILFDISSADLTPAQRALLHRLRDSITPEATVRISGHTDHLGDGEHNRLLSEQRAAAVAHEIAAKNMTIHGLGETRLLYDNTFPEGRFYCRTVTVTVETPVQY